MIWIAIYLAAIVTANLSIATFGPVVAPINAFLLIALDLVCRDKLHDAWAHNRIVLRMGALIAAGGVLSYLLNPAAGQIAMASSVSFVVAAIADAIAYGWLQRHPWLVRSNGSNLAGAALDSILFPWLAFGVLMPGIVLAQFVAKVGGGFVWSILLSSFSGGRDAEIE